VHLTHPQRELLRDPLITKQDLADFYRSIARFISLWLVNRPLMLLRCPQGRGVFFRITSRGVSLRP
jgi:bifunctional non-homologous end joining protein LigD